MDLQETMGKPADKAALTQVPAPPAGPIKLSLSGVITVPHGEFVTIPNPPCGVAQPNVSLCVPMTVVLYPKNNLSTIQVIAIHYFYHQITQDSLGQWVEVNEWFETFPLADLGWAMIRPQSVPEPQPGAPVTVTALFANWSDHLARHGSMTVEWEEG